MIFGQLALVCVDVEPLGYRSIEGRNAGLTGRWTLSGGNHGWDERRRHHHDRKRAAATKEADLMPNLVAETMRSVGNDHVALLAVRTEAGSASG